MWSCAGVAARAEGAGPAGLPWELWVCSDVVSERDAFVILRIEFSLAVNQKRAGQSQLSGQSQPWLLFSPEVVLVFRAI